MDKNTKKIPCYPLTRFAAGVRATMSFHSEWLQNPCESVAAIMNKFVLT
jgi:hypothetical protein